MIFAGGVIAVSALIASVLGSNYTPSGDRQDSYSSARGVEKSADPNAPARVTRQGDPKQASAQGDDLFGSFEGFATDEELIAETRGFSTTPGQETAIITTRNNPTAEPAASLLTSEGGQIVDHDDASIVKRAPRVDGEIPDGALRKSPNYGKTRELKMAQ